MEQNETIGPLQKVSATMDAVEEALVLHYSGLSMREAFERVDGASRSTYYRLSKDAPDEIDELKTSARRRAMKLRSEQRLSADAHIEEQGIEAQRSAAQALIEAIPTLAKIAAGIPWDVDVIARERDDDGDWVDVKRKKTVVPYPTSIAGAANTLHAIVKDGFMPEGVRLAMQHMDDDQRGALNPIFQAMTSFSSVKAVKPDGSSVEITHDASDVVDGEVVDAG
jgi:hypothetical protein